MGKNVYMPDRASRDAYRVALQIGPPDGSGFVWFYDSAQADAAVAAKRAYQMDQPVAFPPEGYLDPGAGPLPPNPAITISITALSKADPAVATVSAADGAKVAQYGRVTIAGATGTNAADINKLHTIGAKTGTTFELDGEDSTAWVFSGLPFVGTLSNAPAPAPAPSPAPSPSP